MTRPNAHFFSFASGKTIVSGRVGPKTMKVVQYEIYSYSFPFIHCNDNLFQQTPPSSVLFIGKYIHKSTNFTMILFLLLAEKSIFATRNCFW